MNLLTLVIRSLRFHSRGHLGVLLGAAVGSAALIGALVVGDSVRGSLRESALQRLGGIAFAIAPQDRLFRDELRFDLVVLQPSRSKPYSVSLTTALSLAGTAARQDGFARANQVHVISLGPGLDHFARMPGLTNLPADGVILNSALAAQLHAKCGDSILLRVNKPSALPREGTVSPKNDATAALRLRVHEIATADVLGNFSLTANQLPPFNAFVRSDTLQKAIGIRQRANLLLSGPLWKTPAPKTWQRLVQQASDWLRKVLPIRSLSRKAVPAVEAPTVEALGVLSNALRLAWKLEDAQLDLAVLPERGVVELRSPRVFLEPAVVSAALASDQLDANGRARRTLFQSRVDDRLPINLSNSLNALASTRLSNAAGILTYLVNQFRAGDRTTPYSMVAAVETIGLEDNEILINQWLADDLQVKPGAEIDLTYYLPDSGALLIEATNRFRVRAILPMSGPLLDRTLMPDFPGLAKAESTHDWDAGFPLIHKIRDQDDQYWKDYRGTPKAFITLAAGRKMWANRFGDLTAIRWAVSPPTNQAPSVRGEIEAKLLNDLKPEDVGLSFEPVRDRALAASEQAQDFGGLFLGFSFFLIVAALILMALLFQFGLEQRTAETGTLLALGFTPRQVRGLLLREGLAVAFLGGALGVLGGLGYAKAMLHLLTTLWRDAVGGSALRFHVTSGTVVIGLLASVVVCAVTIWVVLRRQARRPARELLAGSGGSDAAALEAGPPLTPALSPLRGEGDATDARGQAEASRRAPTRLLNDATAQDAAANVPISNDTRRAPSPRNGERAGVRGEDVTELPNSPRPNRARWLALTAGTVALALVGWAIAGQEGASAPIFFGAGALLLVAGLAAVSMLLAALDRSEAGQKLSLFALGLRACTRRRLRSLASVALLACGSFLIVAVGANRLDAGRDATKRSSGTGGFALFGESTLPIVRDLNSQAGREFYGLDEEVMRGVNVVPFRVRDGDEASCLNLNRAQKPRLLGVKPELLAGRGAFTFAKVARNHRAADGWRLLERMDGQRNASPLTPALSPLRGEGVAGDARRERDARDRAPAFSSGGPKPPDAATNAQTSDRAPRSPSLLNGERAGVGDGNIETPPGLRDEIPAIGDAASIQWALGKKLGDTVTYTDERGREFKVRLVAGVANSILQGNLIIDENEFLKRFPGEAGHRMFLIDIPSNDPADIEKVSAALSRALQDVGLESTPTTRRLAAFNAVQNTYLNTFQVLGGLGLLLGSAGLGVVVLRNVLERRGELGLLQAVGFTRRSLRRLVLSEHGGLLALGLLVGIASALLAIAPVLLAPGARLHATALGLTLAGVLASGLLWTWAAVRMALRGRLLEALRDE